MKRRRVIKLAMLCAVLVFLILLGIWYYLQAVQALPVKRVQVAGDFKIIGARRIQTMLLPDVEHGMFNVSEGTIAARLKQFPVVKSVDVSRIWPSTIRVTIRQYQLLARLPSGEVITHSGKRFHPKLKLDLAKVPLFVTIDHDFDQVKKAYEQFSKILKPAGLNITTIEVTQAGEWQLQVDQQFWIYCGNNDVIQRLTRFAQAYPQLIAKAGKKQLAYVDLRYHTGFAARWK